MIAKILGAVLTAGLFSFAIFLALSPWRVHGGRFVSEYLLLAGIVGIVALASAALTLFLT